MKRCPRSSFPLVFLAIVFSFGAADSCGRAPQGSTTDSSKEAPKPPEPKASDQGLREADADTGPGHEAQEIARFWKDPKTVEALGLSDQQIQSFEFEAKDFIENLGSSRRLMRISYQKLIVALNQEPVDEHVVEAAERRFREAGADRYRLMTGQLMEFRRILTQKQWIDLRTLRPRALQIDRFRPVPAEKSGRAFISGGDPAKNGSAEPSPDLPDDH